MWKKIVAMSLVLVLFLSFTACAKAPSVQEIIDGVIESQDDLKSHKLDINISVEAAGEAEGEPVEVSMSMDYRGVMDIENKEMSADISTSTEMTGEDKLTWVYEIYLVDDMAYIKVQLTEEEFFWTKEELPEEVWEETIEMPIWIESYLSLLELAEVTIIGSEKVKGVDCYVLELTPDLEQLWETVTQQLEAGSGYAVLPYVDEEVLREAFTSLSVKQWVTKTTYFLTKSEIDISMEMTPEIMDFMGLEGTSTMGINITFLSYDHNQPISIVVPPEALEATASYVSEEPTPTGTETVTFPDENLAAAVRAALGKGPDDKITVAELGEFTELGASEQGIANITGIEYCVNLTVLGLERNQISDISPLVNLTSLEALYLGGNQISDVSPLANLTKLTVLGLERNQISDISPLTNLTRLTTLQLDVNQISDISPLANLTRLRALALNGNQLSDISPLANLTNLSDYLFLSANPISDVSPLANLTKLTVLGLERNQISDISPLANLTSLISLALDVNQISDISPLANLNRLILLQLTLNQISDISPLASLTSLTTLYLNGNQISDISPLISLTNLTHLSLEGNPLNTESVEVYIPQLEQRGVKVSW